MVPQHHLLTGQNEIGPAADLAMATTNAAHDPFPPPFPARQCSALLIARPSLLAAFAFYEGRKAVLAA